MNKVTIPGNGFILDIDGTIIESYLIDGNCFKSAIRALYGDVLFYDDWNSYGEVTDPGIFKEMIRVNFNRNTGEKEIERVKQEFIRHLSKAGSIRPVQGIFRFLECIKTAGSHCVFVTGGWRESALVKLGKAGIDISGFKLFSANDADNRETLLQMAVDNFSINNIGKENIYYIGDGAWDFKAAQKMGIQFILRERSGTNTGTFTSDMDPYFGVIADFDALLEAAE